MSTNNTNTNNNGNNAPKTQPVKLQPQNINKTTKTVFERIKEDLPKKRSR